ncbi:MAG: sigma-70 family RNA polymerase sigma factor [Saprospiraceae bacterium]
MSLELINKCQRGDQKSQRILYEQYRQSWFMTCLRYGSNRTQAEDIFQDGLMSVFKNLKQYDSDKSQFITWSTKIMVNAALQSIRKWKKLDIFTNSEYVELEEAIPTNIYDELSAKELTNLIQKLPDGYRIVFNMYVIEGFKHSEIANILNISKNTSKSQLFKAKRMLRIKLESLFQNEYK